MDNPYLAKDEALFNSEFSLMVWCSWHIEDEKSIITGNNDPNDNDGPMVSGLRLLCDTSITEVICNPPSYDLELKFSNGLSLKIFCCSVNKLDDYENYYYGTPQGWFTVGPGSEVTWT